MGHLFLLLFIRLTVMVVKFVKLYHMMQENKPVMPPRVQHEVGVFLFLGGGVYLKGNGCY